MCCRVHAIVEGDVQGVGLRMFVKRHADHMKLTGWVRNLWNGNVEIIAEGNQKILEDLMAQLKIGPPSSCVTNVIIEWQTFVGEFEFFQIRTNAGWGNN